VPFKPLSHATKNAAPSAAQALKVLADAPGTDTFNHLAQLANLLSKEDEPSRWLRSDMVPRLLSILRSLPASHAPAEAAYVCAAAVAALNNLFNGLRRHPEHSRQFRAMLAADDAACRALVRWGLAFLEASGQLPRGRAVFVPCDGSFIPDAALTRLHPFWTPLTCCLCFLSSICADPSIPADQRLPWGFKGLITPDLVERAMSVGVQYPCGGFLARLSVAVKRGGPAD
jgi:hypothetical protein